MGRVKAGKLSRSVLIKSATAAAHTPPSPTPSLNPEETLSEIDDLLLRCDFSEAKSIAAELARQYPHNVRALETLGTAELELGETKKARKHFLRCIELSPEDASPSAHLYLAQLCDTAEQSLSHFTAALTALRTRLDKICAAQGTTAIISEDAEKGKERARPEEELETRRSCSRALVSMTELYLTDLCFDPEAEAKCLECLSLAASLDPTDPEPLTTLASVRLSQSQPSAAKEALLLSWSLWRDASPFSIEGDGADDALNEELPPIEGRVQWAKLAMECELYGEAVEVLQSCEAENDEDGEVQYLLAIAWDLMGESRSEQNGGGSGEDAENGGDEVEMGTGQDNEETRVRIGNGLSREECWIEAREYFDSCLKLRERQGEDSNLDTEMVEHVKELLNKLSSAGIGAGPAEPELEVIDENAWSDMADDDAKMDEL